MRDEAPKAPVLLYALEGKNAFSLEKEPLKHELMNLNRGLWLGDLLPTVDLAIPFDSDFMQSEGFSKQANIAEFLQGYKGREMLYHQSALQSIVMHTLASRLARPEKGEDFKDIHGRGFTDLSDLVGQVLYSQSGKLALPMLQFPLKGYEG